MHTHTLLLHTLTVEHEGGEREAPEEDDGVARLCPQDAELDLSHA